MLNAQKVFISRIGPPHPGMLASRLHPRQAEGTCHFSAAFLAGGGAVGGTLLFLGLFLTRYPHSAGDLAVLGPVFDEVPPFGRGPCCFWAIFVQGPIARWGCRRFGAF